MHFIKIFFLSFILLFTLLIGFIHSIDPYDKYGINVFGFETKAVAMARENKFNMVEHSRKNYEAFVMGSSSAHRLHTADVEALTGLKTFNYALQHTTPEDYLAITRHILSKYQPKMIFFQMDFYGLNENFKTDTRFYTSPLKTFLNNAENKKIEKGWIDKDYLTLGAISDSFKVIWVNLAGKVKHLYLEDGNYKVEKAKATAIQVTQFSYDNYKISLERIELLKEMKKICDSHQVKLIVWSAPYSLEHIQRIEKNPKLSQDLKIFKQELVTVFKDVYDFTNLSIAPYNTPVYFRDSSHPTRELFQVILKTILNSEDSKTEFGKKL